MKQKRGRGAPPGLTVHWLLDALHGEFTRAYKTEYNRKFHHYRFARYRKRTLVDEFLVIRTSKRCYRVSYFNADFRYFQFFSSENYRDCAYRIIAIYEVFKAVEQKKDSEI